MLLPNLNHLPFFFKLLSLSNPLLKKSKLHLEYTQVFTFTETGAAVQMKSLTNSYLKHSMATLPCKSYWWQNLAMYSSVLLHYWPQKQTAPLGNWVKSMSQQIPTEISQEAEDCPCPISRLLPHGNLEPGPSGAVSFQRPHWTLLKVCLLKQTDQESPGRWYHCPMSPWNANFHFEGTQRHKTAQA